SFCVHLGFGGPHDGDCTYWKGSLNSSRSNIFRRLARLACGGSDVVLKKQCNTCRHRDYVGQASRRYR
ncbi:MAG TPA: hypothetical protein VN952_07170, partial [Chthoniobacterales bacterium]|nr:hypothetical protein [Chthoniobacterales bacterium]